MNADERRYGNDARMGYGKDNGNGRDPQITQIAQIEATAEPSVPVSVFYLYPRSSAFICGYPQFLSLSLPL